MEDCYGHPAKAVRGGSPPNEIWTLRLMMSHTPEGLTRFITYKIEVSGHRRAGPSSKALQSLISKLHKNKITVFEPVCSWGKESTQVNGEN